MKIRGIWVELGEIEMRKYEGIKEASCGAFSEVNEGEAKRVIAGIGTAAKNLLSQGWSFKIAGIGSFSLGITGAFCMAAQSAPLNRLHGVEHGPVIDSVEDKNTGAINSKFSPRHGVQISGKDIKIAGTNSLVGIHLIDETMNVVPVLAGDIPENGPTKLLFICPPLNNGEYTIQVTTQYKDLVHPRSYVFNAPLPISIP